MSTKTETNKRRQELEPVDQDVDKLATSHKFFKGVSRYILAIKRNRILEAENLRLEEEKLELQATNKLLFYENTHDDLTGILNRKALVHKIGENIEKKQPFGVIFLDLDRFKAINDNLGHRQGDEVLIGFSDYMRTNFVTEFSKYMSSHFRREGEVFSHMRYPGQADGEEPSLGRLGGDEFAIVVNLSDRGRPDGLTYEQRMVVAENYSREVTQGFVFGQDQSVKDLNFGVSQGSAIWDPEAPILAGELLHQADSKMYLDKGSDRRPA